MSYILDQPVGEGEFLLQDALAEVWSQVDTRLEGRVAHYRSTTALTTQRYSEVDSLSHNNCQLVSEPVRWRGDAPIINAVHSKPAVLL